MVIVDSGLGGKLFYDYLSNSENILFIDSTYFPYGNKDLEFLKKRLIDIRNKYSGKMLIACNTLSSIIYYYDLKFYEETIDVIKPTILAIKSNNYNKVTILCTKNTIKMNVYEKLLNFKVDYIDSTELISLLEKEEDYSDELNKILGKIKKDTQVVILGCTHLIKIKNELRKYYSTLSQEELFSFERALS